MNARRVRDRDGNHAALGCLHSPPGLDVAEAIAAAQRTGAHPRIRLSAGRKQEAELAEFSLEVTQPLQPLHSLAFLFLPLPTPPTPRTSNRPTPTNNSKIPHTPIPRCAARDPNPPPNPPRLLPGGGSRFLFSFSIPRVSCHPGASGPAHHISSPAFLFVIATCPNLSG